MLGLKPPDSMLGGVFEIPLIPSKLVHVPSQFTIYKIKPTRKF